MIRGIGVDIVEIHRIAHAIEKLGDRFLKRIYTPHEIASCMMRRKPRISEFAARFAAKEAYMKAIGTGWRGIRFRDIEVRNDPRGKPYLRLPKKFPQHSQVSLTHGVDSAIAVVVVEE